MYSATKFFTGLFFILLLKTILSQQNQPTYYAQGNVQVIFNTTYGKGSITSPLRNKIPDLWCQAVRSDDRKHALPIKSVRIMHVQDGNTTVAKKQHAIIRNNVAYVHFDSEANIENIGKYKCEIFLEDDTEVHGNMFIRSRPVFIIDEKKMNLVDTFTGGVDTFDFTAESTKGYLEENITLECPVVGNPIPHINWYKNDEHINTNNSDKYRFNKASKGLTILNLKEEDAGNYRCEATNSFINSEFYSDKIPHTNFTSKLRHQLTVSKAWGWLLPLLVIIIILLLLLCIIFGCAAINKWRNSGEYYPENRGNLVPQNLEETPLTKHQEV
uniref:Ig-like domain-containing protein n=1 Tax=Parastrongyloides trichosuri TaxID=131310 RepID=A0A0N4ZRH3_PARTI